MILQHFHGWFVARRWPPPFALTLIIPVILGSNGAAQPVSPTAPNGPAFPEKPIPVYTLDDCLAIGRSQQPTLQAAQASLAAAQTAERGLNEIRFGQILARDLPARRQQAAHGVAAAAANLCQVERDVDCSIARMFYSVIYAREQKKVTTQIVNLLSAVEKNGRTMLGKEGAPPDLNPLAVEKAHLYLLKTQERDAEADAGLQRALAGLREAMGLCPDVSFAVAEARLPEPLAGVSKQQIICMALSQRGEIEQANNAAAISELEIEAQQKSRFVKRPTAAAGGDMHARPIPTGSFGEDYKPGAIGIDFPTLFVGPRSTRVERANDLAARNSATADKTRNLIALEAEDAYLRWEEAFTKIGKLRPNLANADSLSQKLNPRLVEEGGVSYRDILETQVLIAQFRAELNEALYRHAVALTELERVTGGGFAAGITIKAAGKP